MSESTGLPAPARVAAVDGPVRAPRLPGWARPRVAAAVRIGFGLVWAADAVFKWLPGFVHGTTLSDELGGGATVHTPVIHQWIELWYHLAMRAPGAFAVGTAIVETLIAVCLLLGAFSNAVFVGSAVFSFGIWSAAEHFHLPWTKPGMTDLGPSIGYVFAALALYCAAAGSTWSVDGRLRPRLGRLGFLAAPGL